LSNKRIHIVSFDVPFPANYGGVIDVFYRIKALYELGYEITLHCFEYGRSKASELEKYTCQTIYYPRKKSIWDQFSSIPFIVKSRKNANLLHHLQQDDNPILFEGIHTTGFLQQLKTSKRILIVRAHNIEHAYYHQLASNSTGWKKLFYWIEAKKLKSFESILQHASAILSIKEDDNEHFTKINSKSFLLPASIELKDAKFQTTKAYVLYHGNLSVEENIETVKYLISEIWIKSKVKIPLIIAGQNPSKQLSNLANHPLIKMVSSPSSEAMNQLIDEANIHLLISKQNTGIKLKLLNAMQSTGHIIVNETMLEGTNLNAYCTIANTTDDIVKKMESKIGKQLSEVEFKNRIEYLQKTFDVKKNCQKLFNQIIKTN
jgi:hypothetical protein